MSNNDATRTKHPANAVVGNLRHAVRQHCEQVISFSLALTDGKTPITARTAIVAALAYLISPLDGVPDILPLIGYGDDAAVVAGALSAMACFVTEEHKQNAKIAFNRVFS